ncbi:glycoside hydrolase family 16 protein [Armillaria borealis]|uniref:Glycoside hydrolase family 16 protein n=1 Tax=Armillaria borealis TaxID=47425 RepID=A0AA39JBZ5_9AGAR|nr:glycoside hydrolase family 16 protein [Armillaria borealis]
MDPAYLSSTAALVPASAPTSLGKTRKEAETPYAAASLHSKSSLSISSKYSLAPDPHSWGSNLDPYFKESDDYLHNPTVKGGRIVDDSELSFSSRGVANLGCLSLLCMGILALFIGYPVVNYRAQSLTRLSAFDALGVNGSGQVPVMLGNRGLIDVDTPASAHTKQSRKDQSEWRLVFSDEFNTDGRSFYPGEDPYWEAVDLHYWATNNMEWYDPAAVTTAGGHLVITLSQQETHGLDYQGGLVSSWNKFCFTGGYIEAAVQLPGASNVMGLWPAVWTMGNLGRAGYGASLEGMWPYSYDACDVGTAPNQTIGGQPAVALTSGLEDSGFELSYLPGQRLSRCTCSGESHPGPMHSDGTFVGRSAPEIDIFEGQITGDPLSGQVSQSGQWAPFNKGYIWDNSSDNLFIQDPSISVQNTYLGGVTQQATSVVTNTDQDCYQLESGCFSVYGFEVKNLPFLTVIAYSFVFSPSVDQYKPGYDGAYITWVSDDKIAWSLNAGAVGADSATEIAARQVPAEPMYIMANLGMSTNFGTVDLEHLQFPATMLIDYIRVYQDPNNINIGCDPPDFPTQTYINAYIEAYSNANLTTWRDDYQQPFPKNSLVDGC